MWNVCCRCFHFIRSVSHQATALYHHSTVDVFPFITLVHDWGRPLPCFNKAIADKGILWMKIHDKGGNTRRKTELLIVCLWMRTWVGTSTSLKFEELIWQWRRCQMKTCLGQTGPSILCELAWARALCVTSSKFYVHKLRRWQDIAVNFSIYQRQCKIEKWEPKY